MKLLGMGRNLFVREKQAELFDSLGIKNSMLCIFAAQKLIETVKISEIHACLYCKELRNITLIVRTDNPYKISLIIEKEKVFESFVDYLKSHCNNVEFSVQDKKINGYTSAIVEKLKEGTILTIIDKKAEIDIIYCPDCGVQYDPGIPYCMECGAVIG